MHALFDPSILFPILTQIVLLLILGFALGRFLALDPKPLGLVVLCVVIPLVVIQLLATHPFHFSYFLLIFLSFLVASILAIFVRCVVCPLFGIKGPSRLVLAALSGTANVGAYGLPIALVVLPKVSVLPYLFYTLGLMVYEATTGYALLTSEPSLRRAALRVLKLPVFYAMIVGVLLNLLHVPLPGPVMSFLGATKGVLLFLGILIVGITFGGIRGHIFRPRFFVMAMVLKHLLVPLVAAGVIFSLHGIFGISMAILFPYLLLSMMPISITLASCAATLGWPMGRVALTIVLSLVLSSTLIPLFLSLYTPV